LLDELINKIETRRNENQSRAEQLERELVAASGMVAEDNHWLNELSKLRVIQTLTLDELQTLVDNGEVIKQEGA